jgi:tRNA modification GTPase
MNINCQTVAARLTPAGNAALAVVAIRGPEAWNAVARHFTPLKATALWPPATIEVGVFWLGRFGDNAGQRLADQAVLSVIRDQPDPWLELHCHGGPEVVRWVLEILESEGTRIIDWAQMYSLTASRASAERALSQALTTRTASALLDQVCGAFDREVQTILGMLAGDPAVVEGRLSGLARYATLGKHLTEPWRIAILGAPNVGKSTLLNALAGYQRAIVSPTAGTTRDIVSLRTAIDGWPVEFSDTAGMRSATANLERQGVERAKAAAGASDLCLWLLDASTTPVWPDFTHPALPLVINKMDLPAAWNLELAADAVKISAETHEGLDALCARVSAWLVPQPPPPGSPLPYTSELADLVLACEERWRKGSRLNVREILEGMLSVSDIAER